MCGIGLLGKAWKTGDWDHFFRGVDFDADTKEYTKADQDVKQVHSTKEYAYVSK